MITNRISFRYLTCILLCSTALQTHAKTATLSFMEGDCDIIYRFNTNQISKKTLKNAYEFQYGLTEGFYGNYANMNALNIAYSKAKKSLFAIPLHDSTLKQIRQIRLSELQSMYKIESAKVLAFKNKNKAIQSISHKQCQTHLNPVFNYKKAIQHQGHFNKLIAQWKNSINQKILKDKENIYLRENFKRENTGTKKQRLNHALSYFLSEYHNCEINQTVDTGKLQEKKYQHFLKQHNVKTSDRCDF